MTKAPIERVRKYLAERAKLRHTDYQEIHSLHVGDERETILLASDLQTLIDAASAGQQPIRWLMPDGSCTQDKHYGENYGGKPLYAAPVPPSEIKEIVIDASKLSDEQMTKLRESLEKAGIKP